MDEEKSTSDGSAGKTKGPGPLLFLIMLVFIVGVLVFMMVLSPTRKGPGGSGQQSAPSQSSH